MSGTPEQGGGEYRKGLLLLAVVTAEILGLTGAGALVGYGLVRAFGLPFWVLVPTSLLGLCGAFLRINQWAGR